MNSFSCFLMFRHRELVGLQCLHSVAMCECVFVCVEGGGGCPRLVSVHVCMTKVTQCHITGRYVHALEY